MYKLKNSLMVLLAICIIVGCAVLPAAVTEFQDKFSWEQLKYDQISSIELDFSQKETGLPTLGKLELLQDCVAMERLESEASKTKEEILAALEAGLQPYIDQNLLPDDDGLTVASVIPTLVYNPEDPTENMMLWCIELTNPEETYSYVSAIVDDESGHILALDFHSDGDFMLGQDWESFCIHLAETFFSALELEFPSEDWLYNPTFVHGEPEYLEVKYSFGDLAYGEVLVTFSIYPNGFYMFFG